MATYRNLREPAVAPYTCRPSEKWPAVGGWARSDPTKMLSGGRSPDPALAQILEVGGSS